MGKQKFIDWIQEEYSVTITENSHISFNIGFTQISSKDGYDLYALIDNKHSLMYGADESIIYYEHNLYRIIADEIKFSLKYATIYLSDVDDWIEEIAYELGYEEDDEDEDEEL